ncbi:hypothetical protein EYR40_000451 [Pleurotus pulmonarius]|nr:hypothetical protein EYR36_004189 [Pleurotus pulmonarius]KAF4608107.1 hypothetical protein EYR40_000451 [Pleurotus pulmonarius]
MQWLRDGWLYVGFDDGELLTYRPNDNAELLAIEGLTILEEGTPVTRFDVHLENQSLVAAGGGIIRVWARPTEADTWKPRAIQPPGVKPSSQREAFVLVAWVDAYILIVYRHHGAMQVISHALFHSSNPCYRLWDPVAHSIIAEIGIEGPILSADVSPDRRLLVVSTSERYKVFEISSGSLDTSFPSPVVAEEPRVMRPVIFIHSGRSILGGRWGSAAMFYVESGSRQQTLPAPGHGCVRLLAVRPT